MTNVPPGGGFSPPPSGPPPGGGYPPPPPGGGYPPPGGGGFPPPGGGGFPPPGGGGFPPPGGGGYPPPGGPPGGYGQGGFQGATSAPVEWQDRLISGVIDILLPWVVGGFLAFVIGIVVAIGGNSSGFGFGPNWVGLGVGILPVGFILWNGYQAGETGQSLGMKQAGLKMVDQTTGQLVGGSRGLQRNALIVAVYVVNYLCCGSFGSVLLLVDCLLPLGDARNQTLRDKIGKTVVIRA
jgi:uncharacterized RDD family membrane protein YckC